MPKNLGTITDPKDIITKEYLDMKLDTVGILASEGRFKSDSLIVSFKEGFDYLCIETFENSADIDSTLDDGDTVINNYFNSTTHTISKTSEDTLVIQSRKFDLESTPYSAWIYADYDGSGGISLEFSKNNGSTWTSIPNDTVVSINALVQKEVRIKITMVGVVRLKNIAWGVK